VLYVRPQFIGGDGLPRLSRGAWPQAPKATEQLLLINMTPPTTEAFLLYKPSSLIPILHLRLATGGQAQPEMKCELWMSKSDGRNLPSAS